MEHSSVVIKMLHTVWQQIVWHIKTCSAPRRQASRWSHVSSHVHYIPPPAGWSALRPPVRSTCLLPAGPSWPVRQILWVNGTTAGDHWPKLLQASRLFGVRGHGLILARQLAQLQRIHLHGYLAGFNSTCFRATESKLNSSRIRWISRLNPVSWFHAMLIALWSVDSGV